MSHLNVAEAVPLGYAMVARVAEDAGVRALMIKGPVSPMYGLPRKRQSLDVDCLVEPDGFEKLLSALAVLGWSAEPTTGGATLLTTYSITLNHSVWPITLDVHRYFPGFLVSPTEVFNKLYERHTIAPLAGTAVVVPDASSAVLIRLLHLARDPVKNLHSIDSLVEHVKTNADSPEIDGLSELATELGCAEVSRLMAAHRDLKSLSDVVLVEEMRVEWIVRTTTQEAPGTPAAYRLLASSKKDWLKLGFRYIHLPEEEMRRKYPWISGPGTLLAGRMHRIGRAVWIAPKALWLLTRAHLKVRNDSQKESIVQ